MLWTPEGFLCLSRVFVEFSLKPVYPTMIVENLQIHGVQITGKSICETKYFIYSLLLMPTKKNSPAGSYHNPQTEGN